MPESQYLLLCSCVCSVCVFQASKLWRVNAKDAKSKTKFCLIITSSLIFLFSYSHTLIYIHIHIYRLRQVTHARADLHTSSQPTTWAWTSWRPTVKTSTQYVLCYAVAHPEMLAWHLSHGAVYDYDPCRMHVDSVGYPSRASQVQVQAVRPSKK